MILLGLHITFYGIVPMKFPKTTLKYLILIAIFQAVQPLWGQAGGAFYADFQLSGKGRQNIATSMVQDSEGNLQMATLGGVVIFDGTTTSIVGTGAAAAVLEHVPETQKTYIACEGRIGYIKRNSFGKFVFSRIEVKGVDADQYYNDICTNGKDIYFLSSDWVLKVTDDKLTAKWKRPEIGNFSGLFALKNSVFVNVSGSGLYILDAAGSVKKHAINDASLVEEEIMFATNKSKDELIIGTSENRLFIFNGAVLKELETDKAGYIKTNQLLDGKKLNNTHMVLATYYGGVLVVNMTSGVVSDMYNTGTGFPDDQVFSITVDKSQGIWVNHESGFTRIDRNLPVRYFSSYPGIAYRVYSVAESNGILFAGCSDGLYKLKTVDNAAEYDRAVKMAQDLKKAQKENKAASKAGGGSGTEEIGDKGPEEANTPAPATKTPEESTIPDDNALDRAGKKIKGIWDRVKKKIPGGGTDDDKGTKNPNGEQGYSSHPVSFERVYRSNEIFHFAVIGQDNGQRFLYSKIEGINSKVKKILVTPTGLLCVTNTGLYEYNGSVAQKLFNGEIKDAIYAHNKIVFITAAGPYLIENGVTIPINIQSRYRSLNTVFLETSNTLWLGGNNRVVKVSLGGGGHVLKEVPIDIPAEFPDYISICKAGQVVFFVSGGGLFEYQASSESAIAAEVTVSSESEQLDYVINPAGNTLFIKTIDGWKEVKNHNDQTPLGLLDVVGDVRYVYKNSTGNAWALNNKGEIFYLNIRTPNKFTFAGFDVFIRGVLGGFNGNPFDLSDLNISYREGAIEIKWGSNLYLKSEGTWYQYKIEGAGRSQWSQWTKQTSLKIQLTPGNYTFVVRAKDVLGNISPERKISFSIDPPFWQTWYFYTLMALLLAAAIYFIFRWRNRALIENQKRLEAMVVDRTTELAEEKEKTEGLLLNILPKAVAQELKELGQSSVRRHSESAVMFTDFCEFTKLSMNMTAEELVEKLDSYFRKFDEIVEKYGLEKIKTIGDAYMCAAGVPQPLNHYSLAIVMAALEILEVVKSAEAQWKIRVGIHQGGLVSGVVGKKKFAYDIWGDTVNVASRMESSSEPMNINITEQVYEQIKDYFDCEKRGEIEAKSLGKTNMYFVKGLKKAYRANGSAVVPNKEFLALLN